MKFLARWLSIKTPSTITLVDIALLLSIVPHLAYLKFPMLVFLLSALALLLFTTKSPKRLQSLLALFGFISIIISFYTDFNFSSLNRFSIFISLINALLILAVVLQRLKRELNFYLIFAPAMLLFLSFFMHNSIVMLFYMVMTLFVFLLLLIWSKMDSPLSEALKYALSIFAFSLPVVALLFMVFPRISFDKKDYGFKDEIVKRSGHNGKMSLGEDAQLIPSQKIVMEVLFKKPFKRNISLYFRGTTLYKDNTNSFTQIPVSKREKLSINDSSLYLSNKVSYDITLYPHNEKWLYTLDLVLQTDYESTTYSDYTVMKRTKVDEPYRYSNTSYLKYRLNLPLSDVMKAYALEVDLTRDEKSAEAALKLHDTNDSKTLENLITFFKAQDLTYTLKPKKLDPKTPIDSFLFDSKSGYCVHFASAFTYMARSAGLPTRIVTGYLMNSSDTYENYLVVRESAAHAWVEVYLEDKGWSRIESTQFAQNNENLENLSQDTTTAISQFLQKNNLKLMYMKYIIEEWILEYSHFKQMDILKKLLHNGTYLFNFLLYSILFIVLTVIIALLLQRTTQNRQRSNYLTLLYRDAKKHHLVKSRQESVHQFLQRCSSVYGKENMEAIDDLYHKVEYSRGVKKEEIITLKKMIRELKVLS